MPSANRKKLGSGERWIVKIGSAMITNGGRGLDETAIADWVAQIAELHRQGKQVALVSSGAVAEGMRRLGWSKRPKALYELQAAAAVGQMSLVRAYEDQFKQHGIRTAQVLLTHEDLADRKRYLNARTTLRTLLKLGVVPVINENDTVASDEFRFGDNDTLGALAANLVEADLYVILTDQKGLFESDPRKNPRAKMITEAEAGDPALLEMAGANGGELGRGGMQTKVLAAAKAARSGTSTWLAWGHETQVLARISQGKDVGTVFTCKQGPVAARKQWLASQLQLKGSLILDKGAERVLRSEGRSLLPVGVTEVHGIFSRGDLVALISANGQEMGRGLVNYNNEESSEIAGKTSDRIESILGYVDEAELVHRDNLVIN